MTERYGRRGGTSTGGGPCRQVALVGKRRRQGAWPRACEARNAVTRCQQDGRWSRAGRKSGLLWKVEARPTRGPRGAEDVSSCAAAPLRFTRPWWRGEFAGLLEEDLRPRPTRLGREGRGALASCDGDSGLRQEGAAFVSARDRCVER